MGHSCVASHWKHGDPLKSGWTRGKADVLYVADAFEVMVKVNARSGGSEGDRGREVGAVAGLKA